MGTLEKRLESRFCNWCKDKGVITVKGPSMLAKGFPDRIVILPNGAGTLYVEFKGDLYYGLTQLQEWWQRQLVYSAPRRHYVVDTDEKLEALKDVCCKLIDAGQRYAHLDEEVLGA